MLLLQMWRLLTPTWELNILCFLSSSVFSISMVHICSIILIFCSSYDTMKEQACVWSSHFMLVCAFVVLCQTVSYLLITWLTSQRNYPCYWLLFFVIILDLPARETYFSQAVIFVDNSGADIILGVLPFARELLRRGTTVYLVLFGNVFTICS